MNIRSSLFSLHRNGELWDCETVGVKIRKIFAMGINYWNSQFISAEPHTFIAKNDLGTDPIQRLSDNITDKYGCSIFSKEKMEQVEYWL